METSLKQDPGVSLVFAVIGLVPCLPGEPGVGEEAVGQRQGGMEQTYPLVTQLPAWSKQPLRFRHFS